MSDDFITAVERGEYDYLREALAAGRSPDVIGSVGKSALLVAAERRDATMVRWLLDHGADVDLYDPRSGVTYPTPFLYAGAEGLDDFLEIMIPHKPDVSIRNGYGGNALIPAAERGHVSTVRLLLERTSVDVNLVNHLGWTALLEVTIYGEDTEAYREIVRLLLESGADAGLADQDGVTPLEHARENRLVGIARLLASDTSEPTTGAVAP